MYQWVEHVYKIVQLVQWSDKCDTSLAVESALCTTGSPRRWSQRVSRKCYESVGAAKNVIMPLPNLARLYPLKAKSIMLNSSRSWNHGLMIFKYVYYITRKQSCKSVQAVYQWVEHVYEIVQLIQWSDKCDTSLAVESALCTTGSPRRWSQRVSRKCYESVGAAKDVIMPLPNQLGKALPSESKINKSLNSSRSWNHGLMIFIYFYYITRKQPCKSVQAVHQWVEHVDKIVQLIQWSD